MGKDLLILSYDLWRNFIYKFGGGPCIEWSILEEEDCGEEEDQDMSRLQYPPTEEEKSSYCPTKLTPLLNNKGVLR